MTGILTNILNGIYSFVGNYGWAIVLFTILIRLLLLPLDIKSRQGMRKMQKIQPELNKIQQKYANDKVKLQQKQSELMRREHYNPMTGCLPLLIQMPILFAMFGAMRQIANEQTVQQVFHIILGEQPTFEGWMWVKNLWMPDSLFASVVPNMQTIQMVPANIWQQIYSALSAADQQAVLANISTALASIKDAPILGGALDFATADGFKAAQIAIQQTLGTLPNYQAAVAAMPGFANLNFVFFKLSVFAHYNGYLILPVLAGLTQVLMTKMTPGMASQPQGDGQQQPGMNNFMKYFSPVFSVYICLSSNAGFALYWVVSNLIATATNIGITAYFDKADRLAALKEGENSVR